MPSLVLLLESVNCSSVPSTSLSLPLASTFVQVMLGAGSPSGVQFKVIGGSPSRTTSSGDGINEGGSAKESRTKESLPLMTCFDHSLFKKRSFDLNY